MFTSLMCMPSQLKRLIPLGGLLWVLSGFFVQPKPEAPLAASVERGKKVYRQICIACHQEDGGGVPRMNPPLTQTTYVLGDKKKLIYIVLNGLKGGEAEVHGEYYENPMPPMADILSDQQIADVLTFVRNSFGNKVSAVKAAEVSALRKRNPK